MLIKIIFSAWCMFSVKPVPESETRAEKRVLYAVVSSWGNIFLFIFSFLIFVKRNTVLSVYRNVKLQKEKKCIRSFSFVLFLVFL